MHVVWTILNSSTLHRDCQHRVLDAPVTCCPTERWEWIPGAGPDRPGHPRWSHRVWDRRWVPRDSQMSQAWRRFKIHFSPLMLRLQLKVSFCRLIGCRVQAVCARGGRPVHGRSRRAAEPGELQLRAGRLHGAVHYREAQQAAGGLQTPDWPVHGPHHRFQQCAGEPTLENQQDPITFSPFNIGSSTTSCRSWRAWAPGRCRGCNWPSPSRGSWMLWLCGSSSIWTRRTVSLQDPRRTPAGSKPSTPSTVPRVRFTAPNFGVCCQFSVFVNHWDSFLSCVVWVWFISVLFSLLATVLQFLLTSDEGSASWRKNVFFTLHFYCCFKVFNLKNISET